MLYKGRIKNFEETSIRDWNFEGIRRDFILIDDEGKEQEITIFIGYEFFDIDRFSPDEIEDFKKEGYEVEEDVVVIPRITVLWEGVVDYEDDAPTIDEVIDKAKKHYPEIPADLFEL